MCLGVPSISSDDDTCGIHKELLLVADRDDVVVFLNAHERRWVVSAHHPERGHEVAGRASSDLARED